jgi:hypothetical protein
VYTLLSTNSNTLSLLLLRAAVTAAITTATYASSQTANDIIDRGYSAVYYLNSTGHYVLAASVLRKLSNTEVIAGANATSEYEVDVPLER